MTRIGVIFPPDRPPEELFDVARAADDAGLDDLWLWEDCFKESGLATAGAVLAWTRQLSVGVGLLPVPLRNPALTAMELATLARLFPDRIRPGLGHGVAEWMDQVGEKVASPMTLLGEYVEAVRTLLHGGRVTTEGRYVQLADVALDWPPVEVPPLLVGGVGPRTVALAGRLGDGVILTGETTLPQVADAARLVRSERPADAPEPEVVMFVPVAGRPAVDEVVERLGHVTTAGATTLALLSTGEDAPPLAEFAQWVGREVAERVR